MYEAIDLVSPRYVYVYAKSVPMNDTQSTVEQPFSRKIK